jgi:type II secretory pathway pseudopilin PulG
MMRLNKQQTGLTIVEILIVLAVIGLIMVVVFLSVGNLNRSHRNAQRSQDAQTLTDHVERYILDNRGNLPTANCVGTDSTCIVHSAQLRFYDEKSSFVRYYESFSVGLKRTNPAHIGYIDVVRGHQCEAAPNADGRGTILSGNTRTFAVVYSIERPRNRIYSQCIDNTK